MSHPWDFEKKNFLSWLIKRKPGKKHLQLEILQSIYFLFRNKQRDKINTLCNQAFENVKQLGFLNDSSPGSLLVEDRIFANITQSFQQLTEIPDSQIKKHHFKKQIDGVLSGNKQVFLDIYENDFPMVVNFVTKNSGTVENAKDIFQDAIVIMLEKYYHSELDLTSSVGAYLFGISKNLWYEQLRRNKKSIDAHLFFDEEEKDDFVFPGEENQPDIYDDVSKNIENLGSNCKKLIQFYYYEKMSWNEIAKRLNYASSASARNQKYKCLEQIKKHLK
jgi:RNA polymerase sigma factor (sigma-70 family)